jgi:hypothetical protein
MVKQPVLDHGSRSDSGKSEMRLVMETTATISGAKWQAVSAGMIGRAIAKALRIDVSSGTRKITEWGRLGREILQERLNAAVFLHNTPTGPG